MTNERIEELREESKYLLQKYKKSMDECLDAIEQLQHELKFARLTAVRAMDAGYQEKP